jgi:hypothetical protein
MGSSWDENEQRLRSGRCSATRGFAAEAVSDLGPQDAYLTVELERGFAGMRRSSPLLDRRNERGQPRAIVLVEIDSEGVLVQRARSRAAIAQEALELPALPAVLDPDQQLPHVAPVPSLLLLTHVHARSLELCRHALGCFAFRPHKFVFELRAQLVL